MTTVRFIYRKGDALRFLGHLDTNRLWQRTLRRAGLPLAFTAGYQPRPKMAMGPPLSLGFTSRVEALDVTLEGDVSPTGVRQAVEAVLQPGLILERVETVTPDTPKLSHIATLTYTMSLPPTAAPVDSNLLQERVQALLDAEALFVRRVRKGCERQVDLRPSLLALETAEPTDTRVTAPRFTLTVAVTAHGTANPREILALMDLWDSATIREAAIERCGVTFARASAKGSHDNTTLLSAHAAETPGR